MCFDLNAACSGFVYALTVAQALLQNMEEKYALVIGSEEISKIMDFKDRNTCVLFGDGAGALVVGNGDGIFASYSNSAGNLEALKAPAISKSIQSYFYLFFQLPLKLLDTQVLRNFHFQQYVFFLSRF